MTWYLKPFKVKKRDKDKNNNFFFSYRWWEAIRKAIWTKFEDLKKYQIKRFTNLCWQIYIKTKIRAHGDKSYNNFCGLNVSEDNIECQFCTVIYLDSLLVYNKIYFLKRLLRKLSL